MNERPGAKFHTVEEFAEHLKPLHMAFIELYKAIKISMTFPVSIAGCERSFSKLKLIKTHLRTTMGRGQLGFFDVYEKPPLGYQTPH